MMEFIFLKYDHFPENKKMLVIKVPKVANLKGVCLQNTSKLYSHHLKIW